MFFVTVLATHSNAYILFPILLPQQTRRQCLSDVGPSSTMLAQHQPNIEPTPRACLDIHIVTYVLQVKYSGQKRESPC